MNWQDRILDDDAAIRDLLERTNSIAVLGIKTEAQAGQPAIEIPRYLHAHGFRVIPVPVYFPEVTHILGIPVVRRLVDIDGPIDMVDVFRRPGDLASHLDDVLAAAPASVWLQSGISDDAFVQELARAGIAVVQDRCLMVEHRRLTGITVR